MPLIPVLEFEPKIQVNDPTRLSAKKSFATSGEDAISSILLTPGIGETPIEIYNADSSLRVLDWAFGDQVFNIDSTLNYVHFEEGGVEKTAVVISGAYSLSALATAIQTAMNLVASFVFTVTYSDNKMNWSSTGTFKLLGLKSAQALLPYLGVKENTNDVLSYKGAFVEGVVKKVTLFLDNGTITATKDFYTLVLSEEGDKLFSSDADLVAQESDIMNWTPVGRASFKDVHRRAQERILDWIYQNEYTDKDGKRLTKFAFPEKEAVRLWSAYMVLWLLFMNFQNANDDVFKEKAKHYEKLMIEARNQSILDLDLDGDGVSEQDEKPSSWSGSLKLR